MGRENGMPLAAPQCFWRVPLIAASANTLHWQNASGTSRLPNAGKMPAANEVWLRAL